MRRETAVNQKLSAVRFSESLQNSTSSLFSCRTEAGDISEKRVVSILSPYGRSDPQNDTPLAVQRSLLFQHQKSLAFHFQNSKHIDHAQSERSNFHTMSDWASLSPQSHSPHALEVFSLQQPLRSVAGVYNHPNIARSVTRPPSLESSALGGSHRHFKIPHRVCSRAEQRPATFRRNASFLYYHHTDEDSSEIIRSGRYSVCSCLCIQSCGNAIFDSQK